MRPLKILTEPNPILKTVCRPDFRIPEQLIPEMFCLLRKYRAFGLAAPQVGINARLFVTEWGEVFINPVIDWHSVDRISTEEGCLSFPGITGHMVRYSSIEIGGYRYDMSQSITIQHELDHLNGITIV